MSADVVDGPAAASSPFNCGARVSAVTPAWDGRRDRCGSRSWCRRRWAVVNKLAILQSCVIALLAVSEEYVVHVSAKIRGELGAVHEVRFFHHTRSTARAPRRQPRRRWRRSWRNRCRNRRRCWRWRRRRRGNAVAVRTLISYSWVIVTALVCLPICVRPCRAFETVCASLSILRGTGQRPQIFYPPRVLC